MEKSALEIQKILRWLKEKLAGGAPLAVMFCDDGMNLDGCGRTALVSALSLAVSPSGVKFSCDGKSAEFFGAGVKPLLTAVVSAAPLFEGAVCADKIVGKAAALLFAYAKAGFVYAETVSMSALDILKAFGIPCEFASVVPFIQNRAGDGQCPMELLCADTDNPREAIKRLRDRIKI